MRRLPVPVLLVCGGLLLGFVPGLPHVELPPDLVLVAILPPLLYSAAFFTGLRDLRHNLRPISLLAVGLVIATTCGVALVAHAVIRTSLGRRRSRSARSSRRPTRSPRPRLRVG